jgi:quercetin dioxygenase-like cupin family protein
MFAWKKNESAAQSAKPWTQKLAGALIACAVGGLAVGLVSATPGAGVTAVVLTGAPVLMDDIDVKSVGEGYHVALKTKGFSDAHFVHYTIAPGGHSGWHSHPGICLVSVKSGTATEYHADDPETPHDFPAGTGFAEEAGAAHLIQNEGDEPLELIVLHLVPAAAPRRLDEPAP